MTNISLRAQLVYHSLVNLKLRLQLAFREWRERVPYGTRAPR
jgi:hypothetical protein